jgi:hypothetical protein
MNRLLAAVAGVGVLALLLVVAPPAGLGQPEKPFKPEKPFDKPFGQPFDKPMFGGPMGERKILKEHDKDSNGWLNNEERQAARAALKKDAAGKPMFGKPMFGKPNAEPPKAGPQVSPSDVKAYPNANLYEPTVVRTLFLEFENKDWEAELADFHNTDVEVPVTLTVDGKKYTNVGVHFRGMSSYMMVGAGYKRSLNLTMDLASAKQRLYGYKTLNLLNSNGDASMLSSVLYSQIARQYMPAPKANFVKVVINGEYWGVYVSVQQFNKEFVAENFKPDKGARWKVSGSPMARGGLEYLGDDIAAYKRIFEIKSTDDEKSWKALINLCKVLNQTPPDKLEAALKPILDIDSMLWFLALDVVLVNSDGYWTRASDYSLFLNEKGKFHIVPHDMNEAFHGGMGFGMGPPRKPGEGDEADEDPGQGPMRTGGVELDPLVGLEDARKPLRSKILAVPALRARYLANVRTIAEEWLDWKKLGPIVNQYRALIDKDVEADTRKLASTEAFRRATSEVIAADGKPEPKPEFKPEFKPMMGMGRGGVMSLRAFADQRRKYLLNHAEIKRLGAADSVRSSWFTRGAE